MLALFIGPENWKYKCWLCWHHWAQLWLPVHSNWKADYRALFHVNLYELDDCLKFPALSSHSLLSLIYLPPWITKLSENSFHPCLLKREKEVTKKNTLYENQIVSLVYAKTHAMEPNSKWYKKIMNKKMWFFYFTLDTWPKHWKKEEQ